MTPGRKLHLLKNNLEVCTRRIKDPAYKEWAEDLKKESEQIKEKIKEIEGTLKWRKVMGGNRHCVSSILTDLIGDGSGDYKNEHTRLCYMGAHWMKRNCGTTTALVERGCGPVTEMPDVIGWDSAGDSYLLEAKTTRSDFLGDSNKEFRESPELGMGKYRFYLYPKGLVEKSEIPDKWGAMYMTDSGRIYRVKDPAPFEEYNRQGEFNMLVAALSNPWKLFEEWSDSQIKHLSCVDWMSKYTDADMKAFCMRLLLYRKENYDHG